MGHCVSDNTINDERFEIIKQVIILFYLISFN